MNCVVVLEWNAPFWGGYPSTQSCYWPAKAFTLLTVQTYHFWNLWIGNPQHLPRCRPTSFHHWRYKDGWSRLASKQFCLSRLPVKSGWSVPTQSSIRSARAYTKNCLLAESGFLMNSLATAHRNPCLNSDTLSSHEFILTTRNLPCNISFVPKNYLSPKPRKGCYIWEFIRNRLHRNMTQPLVSFLWINLIRDFRSTKNNNEYDKRNPVKWWIQKIWIFIAQ